MRSRDDYLYELRVHGGRLSQSYLLHEKLPQRAFERRRRLDAWYGPQPLVFVAFEQVRLFVHQIVLVALRRLRLHWENIPPTLLDLISQLEEFLNVSRGFTLPP